MIPSLAAALHLVSIVLATAYYLERASALRGAHVDPARLERALQADTWCGLFALPLYGAGLWRLFGELEKPLDWYTSHPLFWTKLALLGLLLAFETPVQLVLFPLQVARARKLPLVLTEARARIARRANLAGVAGMCVLIPVASMMARGVGRADSAPRGGDASGCAAERLLRDRCVPCHASGQRLAGLDVFASPLASLVDRPSSQWPEERLVVARAPDRSLLYRKLLGTQGPERGAQMPLAGQLDPASIERVGAWIREGAPACAP